MKTLRLVSALLVVGSYAWAETPRMLIVALKSGKGEAETDTTLANFLGSELQKSGKVSPIIWGMEDIIFRKAAIEGKLNNAPDWPTRDQSLGFAKSLDAQYVFVYVTRSEKGMTRGTGELFSGKRRIWTHVDGATGNSPSMKANEIGVRSIARTWSLMLQDGPLKDLAVKPETTTPEVVPGQAPIANETPVVPIEVQKVDNSALRDRIAALIKAENPTAALHELREAVDVSPLDLERRNLLIAHLNQTGDYRSAATEARRTANLFPENLDLRMQAARAWMKAGEPGEARQDLNEAVSRDPKSQSSLLMLAEVSLLDLAPDKALDPLEMSIKAGPTAQALYMRSIARSLLGGLDGALKDLDQVAKLDPKPELTSSVKRYELYANVLAKAFKKSGDDLRNLIQLATVRPKDSTTKEAVENLKRLFAARQAHQGKLSVPVAFKASHERRALALKLLSLTLADIENCLNGGGEDALADARIDLGEAMKNASAAEETLSTEIGGMHGTSAQP